MPNIKSAANGKRNRLRAPSGKVAPITMVIVTKAATFVAVLVAFYIIAFFSAVRVVPMVMGFVKDGTGVTMNHPVETVLAVWIAPSLFLIALLFGFVFVVMRKIWHLRTRIVNRVSTWALGHETQIAAPTPVGIATMSEEARKRLPPRPSKRAKSAKSA